MEGLMYASKMKMDLNQVYQALSTGTAKSYSLQINGKKILDQNYDPGFYVEHFIKDLEIALS